jgi:RNA polymerase sigma factor (sigma-70 family)
MANAVPAVLDRLLRTNGPPASEAAWADFTNAYSRLLLHVARSGGSGHDSTMDRYTHVLDQLRQDDCRRLRAYVADGRSEFTTWLVVVAQRICLDLSRHRYGRYRPDPDDSGGRADDQAARRRLVDLIGAQVDLDELVDQGRVGVDDAIRVADVHRSLQEALLTLAPADRLLIKLRFEDELSMPEVAANLGLPSRFHAYRRLTEVLDLLRRALERRGVREAEP